MKSIHHRGAENTGKSRMLRGAGAIVPAILAFFFFLALVLCFSPPAPAQAPYSYETIYLGRDNYVGRVLSQTANGVSSPVDLTSVTRIDLEVGGVTVTSTNASSGPIQWAQQGFATGEIRIFPNLITGLGASPSLLAATLIVYDPTNPAGTVWGSFPVLVVQE
jgi:hypothetical protein